MNIKHTALILLCLLGQLTACATAPDTAVVSTAKDGWDFAMPAEALSSLCSDSLTRARTAFTAIENDTAPASLDRVFGAYDQMNIDLQDIQHIWYMKSVHPDPELRAAAEECIREYIDFSITVDLSRKFYQRVEAIDASKLSAPERLMLDKKLRAFRQAGVDRDEATREQVRALINEINELGTEFDKNIREDTRYVNASAAQLAGLPEDFLAAHSADEQGVIRISTDYPDYMPVMKYSSDDTFRRELFFAFQNIATPQNEAVLNAIIEKRHELALLLGYPSWAAMAMDGLMIGSPENAQRFISEVGAAVQKAAASDVDQLYQRQKKIDPGAEAVQQWQSSYLSNLVRQEEFAIDAREIREYFRFDKVQAGIFQLTEDLFNVQIVPWKTDTWHEDVTAWEIRDHGKPIGRFYLDMHPRDNKYKHAAHWTLRTGLKDRQLPMSGMATNFPNGKMEHRQVETFLHEFGHLLHNMFSGDQQWLEIGGMSMERDFVEAPSQMLEEWVWDYDTVSQFATNDNDEVIPQELMDKMVRARHFGEASGIARQIFYANLSLSYYSLDPDSFELLPLYRELETKYSPYPYVPGTHFYNKFGHLNGYSSNYYIYQWSKSISTAMLNRFREEGLRNPAVANDYRQKVLAPGGSRHAGAMVEDFLGKPYSTSAYKDYLNQLN